MNAPLPPGRRVVVSELAEDPAEALEKHVALAPQPAPDPARLGPREVLLAVRSCAVGWVDLIMTSGQYQHLARPPYTPGLEYAGEVLATGPEVQPHQAAPGDRAIVDGLVAGPRSLGPYQDQGGFASYAVVPAEALIPIPAGLDFDQACSLLSSYETAYHALVTRGRLRAGEVVLIPGASGATGLAGVHLARLLGARVIAVGRSPDKLALVQAHGADHVIACADPEGGVRRFRDEVKALTEGRGVDLVYDGVGGDLSLECLRCVRFGARFLIVGWAATPAVAHGKGLRGAPNAGQLPTNLIMMKSLEVLGCPMVLATLSDPGLRPPRLAQILAWAREGAIRPHVSRVYPIDDFKAAMLAKWRGEVVGGCVLRP